MVSNRGEKLIVTFTTIPSRIGLIGPMYQSLLNQSMKADEIVLYVPKKCRREDLGEYNLSRLPPGLNYKIVDFDYGPATKVLPAIKEYRGQNVKIVFCDDDWEYDKNWLARLVQASEQFPDRCICEQGYVADLVHKVHRWHKKGPLYRFLRFASFGFFKPMRSLPAPRPEIFEGYAGVLVKPDFWSSDVFDIPDVLWTVDDVWLSGQLRLNKIELQNTEKRREYLNSPSFVDGIEVGRTESLTRYTYKSYDRILANHFAVKYFQEKYDIWN